MSEYFCPKCGSDLGDQPGFDPDVGIWTCTECGQTLYGDDIYDGDIYPGVMWYCDNCGALLNKQFGFSDTYSSWTCTECGYENPIEEDQIYESEDAYQRSNANGDYSSDDESRCESGYWPNSKTTVSQSNTSASESSTFIKKHGMILAALCIGPAVAFLLVNKKIMPAPSFENNDKIVLIFTLAIEWFVGTAASYAAMNVIKLLISVIEKHWKALLVLIIVLSVICVWRNYL